MLFVDKSLSCVSIVNSRGSDQKQKTDLVSVGK